MAISDFSVEILRILDEAPNPMSPDEVAEALSEKKDKDIVFGRIRPYLEYALDDYVKETDDGEWEIASPHHGRFSPSKRPVSKSDGAGSESQEATNSAKKRNSTKETAGKEIPGEDLDQDVIKELVVQVLSEADAPLRAQTITERVKTKIDHPSLEVASLKTRVNRVLQLELSSRAERDDNYKWALVSDPYGGGSEPDEISEAETADSHRNDASDSSSDVGEKESSGAPVEGEESPHDERERLSFFEKDILGVLDQATGYLSTTEVREALREQRGRKVASGQALNRLENTLNEYVTRTSEGWTLEPSYSGQYSQGKTEGSREDDLEGRRQSGFDQNGEGAKSKREKVERNGAGDEESEKSFGGLSSRVIQILYKSDGPLKAQKIAEKIFESDTNEIKFGNTKKIRKEVRRRLNGPISSFVEKNDSHQWRLKLFDRAVQQALPDSEDEGADPNASEREAIEREQDEETEVNTGGTPSGVFGRVSERLEVAKQIAFLLDLSSDPQSARELASYIRSSGKEVSKEEIRRSVESMLAPFVVRGERGYRLQRKVEEGEEETISGTAEARDSVENSTSQEENTAPIRASVVGQRYEYVFGKCDLETSSLFTSHIKGGTVEIKLNSAHPAFDRVQHVLEDLSSDRENRDIVQLLIVAWTEVEGDLSGERRDLAEEIRADWGRALRSLIQHE